MESNFYNRRTGKFKKSSKSSFVSKTSKKRDHSSVYSLEDEDEDYSQYPMQQLSPTQKEYLQIFMRSITKRQDILLDDEIRSIHLLGSWKVSDLGISVSCTTIQPHVTNATIGLSGLLYSSALIHSQRYFSQDESRSPSISGTTKWCQTLGKYSIPFSDTLLKQNAISPEKVNISNIVVSQTQPIFCVCYENTLYECRLTHMSCEIMTECAPTTSTSTPPSSEGHNYTFRSSKLRAGLGTGPSVTVHSSGIIQYQGKPDCIELVVSGFRDCIDYAMDSPSAMRFLRSLSVVRKLPIP